jgi:RNA polymerase sigma-70 factor (ECF subfamily)
MYVLNADNKQNGQDITFYDRYSQLIYSYIRRQVNNTQDAEDVLLEVFMAALATKNLAQLDEKKQVAWLQRVARNKIIDRYRKHSHAIMLPLEAIQERQDEKLTPEQHLMQQETYKHLHKTLNKLSAQQQQVIYLRFVEGLRFAEIGTIVNKSEVSVRTMVSRLLQRLRSCVEL